ncbi:PA2779 family protein [Pseudomonas mangrovi]|jgi:hypothetical protein|uniref:PA2779 family protein n=1 Tax=Pseudomonas mangrovi TaxID=2161748 RepID=A0A2T5P9E6_9PSED|nr:PA2779 family protein [Pseudomonas mangrovi]PTU74360.1 hypothetical protein DBO85_09700 [Pseudomonas mangrovi]
MSKRALNRYLASVLAAFHFFAFAHVPVAQAAMLGTAEVVAEQRQKVDRVELRKMLDEEEVQERLAALGVDRSQVEERINSLTPAELAQFNQQLAEAPAGASAAGVIVLFLVIFIVTDMLCATDIFSFVKCIN